MDQHRHQHSDWHRRTLTRLSTRHQARRRPKGGGQPCRRRGAGGRAVSRAVGQSTGQATAAPLARRAERAQHRRRVLEQPRLQQRRLSIRGRRSDTSSGTRQARRPPALVPRAVRRRRRGRALATQTAPCSRALGAGARHQARRGDARRAPARARRTHPAARGVGCLRRHLRSAAVQLLFCAAPGQAAVGGAARGSAAATSGMGGVRAQAQPAGRLHCARGQHGARGWRADSLREPQLAGRRVFAGLLGGRGRQRLDFSAGERGGGAARRGRAALHVRPVRTSHWRSGAEVDDDRRHQLASGRARHPGPLPVRARHAATRRTARRGRRVGPLARDTRC